MKKAVKKAKPGRPPTYDNPRTSIAARLQAPLHARIKADAEAAGRSISEEIERRLERSFERQALLDEVLTLAYGPEIAALLTKTGGVVQQAALLRAAQGDTKLNLRRVETELLKELQRVMKEIDK